MLFSSLISFILIVGAQAPMETLEVKGTKERKALMDTTESISILNSHDLSSTGRLNDLEVLNGLANVQVNNNNESFSVRGINSTGVTGFQKDNLASVLIDGLFQTDLATKAGSFNLWDMDRIEVLRGAQSTNQGINSLAGSILLDHQEPQFVTEGGARVTLGNFGHKEAAMTFNTPIVDNRVSTRLSYEKEINEGFITNTATQNEKWGQRNRDRVSGDLGFVLNENHDLQLNGKFNRNRQGGTYSQSANPFEDFVQEDVDLLTDTANQQYSALLTSQLSNDWSNEFFSGFSKSKQSSITDADGTPQNVAGQRKDRHRDHFYTIENRLYYKSEKLTNLLGLHFHDFRLDDSYAFNLLFPMGNASTPVAVSQEAVRTRKIYSIFNTLTYHIDYKNSFTVGVRGEMAESSFGTDVQGQRLQDLGNAVNGMIDAYVAQVSGVYRGTQNNLVFLPKFSYLFGPENSKLGVTYTRGYRTAGVSINRQRAQAIAYDPEFTNNYELSYKYRGDGVRLGANFYYIDWRYQQVQVQLSNNFYDTQVQNAARSELHGGEMDAAVDITPSQELALSVGYTETRFKDFRTLNTDYRGKQFPYAPRWTSRLSHSWHIVEDLRLFTIVRYLTDSYGNSENTRKSDAQFYVNMNLSYRVSSWLFNLYVNNIFDKRFLIYNGLPIDPGSPYQTPYHQANAPREYGLQVTYNF